MAWRDRYTYTDAETERLIEEIRSVAKPLHSDRDLDPLMELIGDSRYVLLGEASHGTSEFYTWRARITKRLIREKGFSFVAVEGDWPDCYRVNRYVKAFSKSGESAYDVLHAFNRWPTWMWANTEIVEFAEWLRDQNENLPEHQRAGFYGLDVYSLWDSMHSVVAYLERIDPQAARSVAQAYRCFEPYGEDVQRYAHATRFVSDGCEEEVIAALREVLSKAPWYREDGREAYFNAEQNALIAKNAERYYRTMVRGGSASWNVRDTHMMETLERLMAHHGPDARAVVWEHNTHIGDARATDMARAGMVNIGQLTRQRHAGDGVVLVGFGSHRGSVIAGMEWEAPMQEMPVPEGRPGSWEDALHRAGPCDKLLLLKDAKVPASFYASRGHRAVGVVYEPAFEAYGNYVPTVLPQRYDAFLFIDESSALRPLHLRPRVDHEAPETYPSGV